jgi:hypothetical protein
MAKSPDQKVSGGETASDERMKKPSLRGTCQPLVTYRQVASFPFPGWLGHLGGFTRLPGVIVGPYPYTPLVMQKTKLKLNYSRG